MRRKRKEPKNEKDNGRSVRYEFNSGKVSAHKQNRQSQQDVCTEIVAGLRQQKECVLRRGTSGNNQGQRCNGDSGR